MKTFIIDWGEKASGARYALITGRDMEDAAWNADQIGSPFLIARLRVPRSGDLGCGYLEMCDPESRYDGASMERLKWMESGDVLFAR